MAVPPDGDLTDPERYPCGAVFAARRSRTWNDRAMERPYPPNDADEREMLLGWLAFQRGSLVSKLDGLNEADARSVPLPGANSVLGLVKHLAGAEARWIDGVFLGGPVAPLGEDEFTAEAGRMVADFVDDYAVRTALTDAVIRRSCLDDATVLNAEWTLRWVVVHLIEETARHAGHADIARQAVDGATGR